MIENSASSNIYQGPFLANLEMSEQRGDPYQKFFFRRPSAAGSEGVSFRGGPLKHLCRIDHRIYLHLGRCNNKSPIDGTKYKF